MVRFFLPVFIFFVACSKAWADCSDSVGICNSKAWIIIVSILRLSKSLTSKHIYYISATSAFCCAFNINDAQERVLRDTIDTLPVSPVMEQSSSFDTFYRQIMIPSTVVELHRKVSQVRLSPTEVKAIRFSLAHGALRMILDKKAANDSSHPPYIRIGCSGRGFLDDDVIQYIEKNYTIPTPYKEMDTTASGHHSLRLGAEHGHPVGGHVMQDDDDEVGSPVILEIWPAQHYSTIHSHGNTTGIMHVVTGQIDVMAYDRLAWNATKVGLLTMSEGQCGWLDKDNFGIHKVFSPMKPGEFAASFHVYLDEDELPLVVGDNGQLQPVNIKNGRKVPIPEPKEGLDGDGDFKPSHNRRQFDYVDEVAPHGLHSFETASDISWKVLRVEIAMIMAKYNKRTIFTA